MKLTRLTPLLAALVACAPAARAEVAPAARPVLERYLAAVGGRAAVDSVHALHLKASIAAFGLTGSTETWLRDPNLRASATVIGPLEVLEGDDGTTAWHTDPSSGKVVTVDGKDLEDARASVYFDADRWLDADQGGGRIAYSGVESDSGRRYDVLEISPPAGRSRRFWFDQQSGLVTRESTKKDQLEIVSTLSDYRWFAGRRYSCRQYTRIVGMPANDLSLTVDSVWVNEVIPDERFRPPLEDSAAVLYLKSPGLARLPFEYSGRHLWLKVAVNGGAPADFLFDTGASISVIDSAYAVKLGLATEGKMQGQGAGSTGSVSLSRLESVRVAAPDGDGVEIHGVKVAVLSINPFLAPYFWRDCAGVLGYEFISRFVDEIDYDARTLTLHDPKTFQYGGAGTGIPFTLAGTIPAIPLKLDGTVEGEFRVDVGSGSTVDLHAPFVKRYDLESKVGKTIEASGGGFGGTFTLHVARMKRLDVGPFGWDAPVVALSATGAGGFASEDYAGNIGNQILSRFKCTFDYERRKLYLEPGKRYGEPDHFTRAGVQFMRSGDIVRAMQVLPGSPAAAAGLKDDDEVVAIEGKPPLSYSPDDLDALLDQGAPGRKVSVRVTRGGKTKELKITLKDMI